MFVERKYKNINKFFQSGLEMMTKLSWLRKENIRKETGEETRKKDKCEKKREINIVEEGNWRKKSIIEILTNENVIDKTRKKDKKKK